MYRSPLHPPQIQQWVILPSHYLVAGEEDIARTFERTVSIFDMQNSIMSATTAGYSTKPLFSVFLYPALAPYSW